MARSGAFLRGKYPISEGFHNTLQDDIESSIFMYLLCLLSWLATLLVHSSVSFYL